MRVALLVTQERGGPVEATVALARELLEHPRGVEPLVIGPGRSLGAGLIDGHVHHADVRSATDRRGREDLRRLLGRLAPDLVHAQDRRSGLLAALGDAGAAPTTRTLHGIPDHGSGWRSHRAGGALRRFAAADTARVAGEALTCRRAAAVVAPSEAMAEFARRAMRVPARRVRVIANGVRPVPLPERPGSSSAAADWEVETFVTVGNFAPAKDVPLLVEAFALVASERPRVRLVLVGDGEEAPRCRALATSAGLGDRIEFTGWRSDVAFELARADAFVLPSRNENMPLALLEAMSVGMPCVASAVGGVAEMLGGGAGIVVDPGDAGALASAMAGLADDPGLAGRIGAAAWARVEDRYTLSASADAYADLWQEVGGRTR